MNLIILVVVLAGTLVLAVILTALLCWVTAITEFGVGVVALVITPASASTSTISPCLIASTASGHSMMARPVLMELR